ncbi:MAG: hypothetical protein H0W09_02890 [Solirubrobacterales bacterium]|nr:hypothetical protein [Solirubrobacterales bacterium]
MTERAREMLLAAAIVTLAATGLLLEATVAEQRVPLDTESAAAFVDGATYCPPLSGVDGVTEEIAVASLTGGPALVSLNEGEVGRRLDSGLLSLDAEVAKQAEVVLAHGQPVAASASITSTKRARGRAAAGCSESAAGRWFFPSGTSAIGYDERLLIFNPFPDEAVVSISFVTPTGERVKSALSDVAVPAGQAREVRVNSFITPHARLGAVVSAVRGRVVAWKTVLAAPKRGIEGVDATLGATAARDTWYFPEGAVGKDVVEELVVLNPSQRTATVTISLAAGSEAARPPGLVNLSVPPLSLRVVSLPRSAPRAATGETVGVSAIVASSNGVGVVAERRISYGARSREGVTSELGATTASGSWLLLPAGRAERADALTILNPSGENARVAITFRRPNGSPLAPEELQAVSIGAGFRVKIPVLRWTMGLPVAIAVDASALVVAERSSYSKDPADASDLMGVPVPSGVRP